MVSNRYGRTSAVGAGGVSSLSAGAATRRSAIAILAGASLLSTARALRANAPRAAAGRDSASESLADLAGRSGLLFGASIGRNGVEEPAYRDLYRAQTRVLTSDIAMKFAALRPAPGPARWAEADLLVDFAGREGKKFRGHNLIWNENNPDWVKSLGASEIGALLDRHIDETVGRYAGRVQFWDVVNEPFWPDHRAPGFFRKGPWFDALGSDYVARALRRAAAADPKAKLVVNEAFTERGDGLGLEIRRRMLRLIDDLRHAGAPLHAIGIEAHLQPQFPSDDLGFVVFLDEIARRGLDIHITELDVDDAAYPGDVEERDRAVADRVYDFVSRALACPAVKVLECWQLSDRHSWYADPSMANRRSDRSPARPLPFDADYRPKPMFDAIARALATRES